MTHASPGEAVAWVSWQPFLIRAPLLTQKIPEIMKTYTQRESSRVRGEATAMEDEGSQCDLRAAESLRKALMRNTAVAEDKIQVKLDDGWICIRIQA